MYIYSNWRVSLRGGRARLLHIICYTLTSPAPRNGRPSVPGLRCRSKMSICRISRLPTCFAISAGVRPALSLRSVRAPAASTAPPRHQHGRRQLQSEVLLADADCGLGYECLRHVVKEQLESLECSEIAWGDPRSKSGAIGAQILKFSKGCLP